MSTHDIPASEVQNVLKRDGKLLKAAANAGFSIAIIDERGFVLAVSCFTEFLYLDRGATPEYKYELIEDLLKNPCYKGL